MLDKSKFEWFFYLISRWIAKQWRQLATSTMHLAQELLTNAQCSGGSRSFAKGTRALRTRSTVAAIGSWQWPTERNHWSCPLTTIQEADKELNVDLPMVVRHLKQIGKVKKLDISVPRDLTENFKKWSFWSVVFSYSTRNNEPFLNRIVMYMWRKLDFIQLAMTSSMLDPEEAPKHFPKPNLHQEKVLVTVWWSAAGLIHSNFLNPSEIITSEKYAQQTDEMHWKLKCLQLASVNKKGSILLHDNARLHITQPMLQKLNELGYKVLPHLPYSPDLLPTDYHFFKHLNNFFGEKMLPQPAGGRKCFPRICWILKHRFLWYRNKQTYFSLAKMCWLQWFLFWLVKMCLSLVILI